MPLLTTRAGASARAFGVTAPSSSWDTLAVFAPTTSTPTYDLYFDSSKYKTLFISGVATFSAATYGSIYIAVNNDLVGGNGFGAGRVTNGFLYGNQSIIYINDVNYAIPYRGGFSGFYTCLGTSNSRKPLALTNSDFTFGPGYYTNYFYAQTNNQIAPATYLRITTNSTNGMTTGTRISIYGVTA